MTAQVLTQPNNNTNNVKFSNENNNNSNNTDTLVDSNPTTKPFGIQSNRQHRIDPITIKSTHNFHTTTQPSYLSADRIEHDYRGLYNLAAIILVVMNARLVVENLLKYGLLIHPSTWVNHVTTQYDHIYPALLCAIYIFSVSPLISYSIEYIYSIHKINSKQADILHIIHMSILFVLPQLFIWFTTPTLLASLALLFTCLIYTLKLSSYAHVSHQLRHDIQVVGIGKKNDDSSDNNDINIDRIKQNINNGGLKATAQNMIQDNNAQHNISNESSNITNVYKPTLYQILYFSIAPTLIYQTSYPRTKRIRIRFCIRRAIEALFCLSLQVIIVEQYILPTIKNTLPYMSAGDYNSYLVIAERTLKLSIPNAICWLLMFYTVFHSLLNLLAELIRFGDRQFYLEWYVD